MYNYVLSYKYTVCVLLCSVVSDSVVVTSFSRVSSWPRNWAHVSCIAGRLFTTASLILSGLRWWLRWYRMCLQCRRSRFNPWNGMIPWRKKWQNIQCSCLGKTIAEEPSRLQFMGSQRIREDWVTHTHTHTYTHMSTLCQNPMHNTEAVYHTKGETLDTIPMLDDYDLSI